MPLDQFFKRHLLPFIHPPICCGHGCSMMRITLIYEMLKEGSYIKLLILRHPCDLLCDLGD